MNLFEKAERNIRQALNDYCRHSYKTEVIDDVSADFIKTLAHDSVFAKQELRQLFSKSPVWDESLDALVINGTRTRNPDFVRIRKLAYDILRPAFFKYNARLLEKVINFFLTEDPSVDDIKLINCLAPKAYAPGKKPSRIFKAICDSLQISDNTAGSEFQNLYAQFADELSTRKIDFKLFVSLNPAHFLTMSNPKCDSRGETLTSCHSLNSTEYEYNCGCAGYARDEYSFIVFTAANPDVPESLNNRKTTRQIFAYEPGNGLLFQSRMYNTSGGTVGAQGDSRLYRDLIQREICSLEDVPNLWKTYDCLDDDLIFVGRGFGGYCDWDFEEFDTKVSIRIGSEDSCTPLEIGTQGLCVMCAEEIDSHMYCPRCREERFYKLCSHCGECVPETHRVYGANDAIIYVCEACRDEHYTLCSDCGWHCYNETVSVVDRRVFCNECLDGNCFICPDCGEVTLNRDVEDVCDGDGNRISVCPNCHANNYEKCSECDESFPVDIMTEHICPDCWERLKDDEEVAV